MLRRTSLAQPEGFPCLQRMHLCCAGLYACSAASLALAHVPQDGGAVSIQGGSASIVSSYFTSNIAVSITAVRTSIRETSKCARAHCCGDAIVNTQLVAARRPDDWRVASARVLAGCIPRNSVYVGARARRVLRGQKIGSFW